MHFKNEAEINTNSCNSAKTAATSISTSTSTSSTDSGIIIFDNNKLNHINENSKSSSNKNNTNNNNYNNTKDNADNTLPNVNISVQQQQNQLPQQHQQQNQPQSSTNNSTNDIYNNKQNNINIENVINITKTGTAAVNERPSYSPSITDRPLTTATITTTATNTSPSQSPSAQYKQSISLTTTTTTPTPTLTTTTTTKHCSPTLSIRSTTISIVSIDENAIDSSIIDSDSDCEADAEGVHSNYIVKKLGQQTTYPPNSNDLPNINQGYKMIGQQINANNNVVGVGGGETLAEQVLNGKLCGQNMALAQPVNSPQIGSIALTNSTDVTFGDKHFYEGPVTIQQFLIDGRDKWKATADDANDGHDNPIFSHENGVNPTNIAPKSAATLSPQEKRFAFILNRKAMIITSLIVLLTVLIGVITMTAGNLLDSPITQMEQGEYVFNGTLRQLDRNEWGGRPPKGELDNLKLPVQRVIISHTASETCTNKVQCSYRCLIIQAFHMDSYKWDDIAYNFLVGGDGLVYIGRGWNKQGAHTKGYNNGSIGISFIGTFTTLRPTDKQLKATELLIADGVRLGKLVKDYRLYGHRQFSGTESPGNQLYSLIKQWPHWSKQI